MSEEDLTILSRIIENYNNPDKNIRAESEKYVEELRKKSMGAISFCLLKLSSLDTVSQQIKLTSLVLLRKIIEVDSKDSWQNVDAETKKQIRSLVLEYFIKEKDQSVKNKFCDVIAELVDLTADFEESWPELTDLALSLNNYDINDPQNTQLIDSLLKMITESVGFLLEEIQEHYDKFECFMKKIFNECKFINLKVRTANLISEIISFSDEKKNDPILNFIYNILETVNAIVEANDEENLIKFLKILVEISSSNWEPLNQYFKEVYQIFSKILEKKYSVANSQQIRELAFEVVISIAETKGSLLSDNPDYLKGYLKYLFQYGLEGKEEVDNDWCNPNALTFSDLPTITEENAKFVNSVVDRLNDCIETKDFQILLGSMVLELLNNPNNHFKYIGLLTLSQLIYFTEEMKEIEPILPTIINLLKSENPKVRFSAANCIEELSSSFQEDFQSKYCKDITPLLIDSVSKETIPRVQCQILTSLWSFISLSSEGDIFKPFLKDCFDVLVELFRNPNTQVLTKKEILITFIEITNTIQNLVEPYSVPLVQLFLSYLDEIYQKKVEQTLMPNLINCISLLGIYCEKILIPTIPSLMKCIIEIILSLRETVNSVRTELQDSLENLIPFIQANYPKLIPDLVETILKLLELSNLKNESSLKEYPNSAREDDVIDCLGLLDTVIKDLEENFIGYFDKTENICFPFLDSYNKKLKGAVFEIFASLTSVLYYSKKFDLLKEKSKKYLSAIEKLLQNEYDLKACLKLINSFNKIIDFSAQTFQKPEINSLCEIVFRLILDVFEPKRLETIKKVNEGKNIQDEEKEMEEEKKEVNKKFDELDQEFLKLHKDDLENYEKIQVELLESIENLLKPLLKDESLLKNYEDVYVMLIQKYLPILISSEKKVPLLIKYPNNLRLAACLIDDIIEYFPLHAISQILPQLADFLFKLSAHPSPRIRQATCYGVGILCKKGTKEIFKECMEKIMNSIKMTLSYFLKNKTREEGLAKDNAIAAIGKAVGYQKFRTKEFVRLWADNIVLKFDKSESDEQIQIAFDFLISKEYENILEEKDLQFLLSYFISIYDKNKSKTKFAKLIEIFRTASQDVQSPIRAALDKLYAEVKVPEIKEKIDNIMKNL